MPVDRHHAPCARRRQEPDDALRLEHPEGARQEGRRDPPPDAVRRPRRAGCQRFATYADLDREKCTIEEREEYEPHIDNGFVVYAGVDYGKILERRRGGGRRHPLGRRQQRPARSTCPTLHICVADPHRAGHETAYHPGEANFRRADVIVINKCDTADAAQHRRGRGDGRARLNPRARVLRADSPVTVERPGARSRGKRVLVVEDGPTLTHGGMTLRRRRRRGEAGGAAEIVDPRPYAVGSIRDTYAKYPNAVGDPAGDGLRRRADRRARGDDPAHAVRRRRRSARRSTCARARASTSPRCACATTCASRCRGSSRPRCGARLRGRGQTPRPSRPAGTGTDEERPSGRESLVPEVGVEPT